MKGDKAWSPGLYEPTAAAQSYRRALPVREIVYFRQENAGYPRCPRCRCTLEREYTAFCDRCGQRLDWSGLGRAMIRLR